MTVPAASTWRIAGCASSVNQAPPAASAARRFGISSSRSTTCSAEVSGASRIRRPQARSVSHIAPSAARAMSLIRGRCSHPVKVNGVRATTPSGATCSSEPDWIFVTHSVPSRPGASPST